jgi:hypothetical protein
VEEEEEEDDADEEEEEENNRSHDRDDDHVPSERQAGLYLMTKRRLTGIAILSLIQQQPLGILWKLMALQQTMRL